MQWKMRGRMWRRGLLAALLLVLQAAAQAQAQGQARKEALEFDTVTKGKPARYAAELFLPPAGKADQAPLAAMVIHHGSGGVSNTREYAYARAFIAEGLAAIVIDSFTPRGVTSTVQDQSAVTGLEFLADAMGVLRAAVAHPGLDAKRIGIVGFSKGGTSALYAALEKQAVRFAPKGERYALHVPFYPGCTNLYHDVTPTGAPVLVLMGAADTYVGSEACLELSGRMRAAGAPVETKIYPDAKHGFDAGPAYSIATGQNFSRCFWVEQADGGWIERTSGIATHGPGGKPIAGAGAKAMAGCVTLGVSGGVNAQAKAQSLQDLLGFVRATFRLN
ncbi:dienelactone hydrolase family protein [Ferrovibrio sp.]|uniref:dienelactone hydrolase family protein n=1 Tax=Ferrovibrio sp. TaxID=1917215 RepID=UPI0035B29DF3